MQEKIMALERMRRGPCYFSPRKQVVDCRWVYNVKLNPDGVLSSLEGTTSSQKILSGLYY